MLKKWVVSVVRVCTQHPWVVIGVSVLLTLITAVYSYHNFSINTDVNRLISPDLPWRQRELVAERTFSQRNESILAVVESPTSELATQASVALSQKLSEQPDLFLQVRNPAENEFFAHNGLLFQSTEQ